MDNFIVFLSFVNTVLADGASFLVKRTGFAPVRLTLFVQDGKVGVRGKNSPPENRVFAAFNPEYVWDGSFSPAQTLATDAEAIDLRHDRFCECSGCMSPSFSDEGWDL